VSLNEKEVNEAHLNNTVSVPIEINPTNRMQVWICWLHPLKYVILVCPTTTICMSYNQPL